MSPVALTLEIVLAVMLAACLFYFWRLDQKLAALRTCSGCASPTWWWESSICCPHCRWTAGTSYEPSSGR
jgi:hypothetical protein